MHKFDRYQVGYFCGILVMACMQIAFDLVNKNDKVVGAVICGFVALGIILIGDFLREDRGTTINGKKVNLNGIEIDSENHGKSEGMLFKVSKTEGLSKTGRFNILSALRSLINPDETAPIKGRIDIDILGDENAK